MVPIAFGSPATVPGLSSEARGVHLGALGVVLAVVLEVWGVIWATWGAIGTSFGRSRPQAGADWEKVCGKVGSWAPPPGTIFGTFSVFFASLFGFIFEGAFGGARELIF